MRPGGLRRTSWAALVGLVGGTAVTAVVAAAPAAADITVSETYARPASGVFKVLGHGWGHGRGLSQHGAYGAATIGKTADQITATYYPGTSRAVLANTSMRVQLRDLNSSSETATFTPTVYAASGLGAKDLATGARIALDTAKSRWRVRIRSADGKLLLEGLAGSTWSLRGAYTGPVEFMRSPDPINSPVRVLFPSGYSRDFRYAVRAVKRTTSMNTIAVMPMESYLRGVVPRESPSSWPAVALQAQTIAARSYSAWTRDHNRTSNPGLPYDICNTTSCQVFGGTAVYDKAGARTSLEAASTNDAIAKTANVVRTYGGKPVFAEFSSSNGGWSTDGGVPYLVAKADPWDGITGSSVHSWTASLPVSALESYYRSAGLGTFRTLTVTKRDGNGEWGGRVLSVVLRGVDASGNATTVTTTGTGIYHARQWPANSTGLRSRWFHIVPEYGSSLLTRSAAPRLVLPPGNAKGTLTAVFRNTGNAGWPVSGLHLALAAPAGGADPLAGGSTRPGAYVKNLTHPGAATVLPGDQVQFAVAVDASKLPAGTRTTAYRVRIGTARVFGATAAWTVVIQAPRYTGVAAGPPAVVSSTYSPPSGAPVLFADRRTVVVPRNGSTTLRLSAKNTGNLSWPVGSTSPVQLGTSGPRDRASASASSTWTSSSRVSHLAAGAAVAPGGIGTFDLQLAGNSKPTGLSTESFEPVWQGKSWISGDVTTLNVVRIEPRVGRAALSVQAPATGFSLANAPTGSRYLTIRLRNVGGQAWEVGKEQLGSSSAYPLASGWPSSNRTPPLRANASRPGATLVAPGEVGEWLVQVSGYRHAVGTYSTYLRAVGPAGFYGPSFPVSVKVVSASFTYAFVSKPVTVTVPSNGTAWTWIDVKNTSNFVWPVGGVLRSTVLAGSSPSRAPSWYSGSRPGSLSANLTSPGLGYVRAGEVARFAILLAGNGRPPQSRSEGFGMSYDGWRSSPLRVGLAYRIA